MLLCRLLQISHGVSEQNFTVCVVLRQLMQTFRRYSSTSRSFNDILMNRGHSRILWLPLQNAHCGFADGLGRLNKWDWFGAGDAVRAAAPLFFLLPLLYVFACCMPLVLASSFLLSHSTFEIVYFFFRSPSILLKSNRKQ